MEHKMHAWTGDRWTEGCMYLRTCAAHMWYARMHTYSQTGRLADMQTGRQAHRQNRQTDRQTNRRTDGQTDRRKNILTYMQYKHVQTCMHA